MKTKLTLVQRKEEKISDKETRLCKNLMTPFHFHIYHKKNRPVAEMEKSSAIIFFQIETLLPTSFGTQLHLEVKFSLKKSTHSTKNCSTKLRTLPCLYRVPRSKFEANRPRRFRGLRYGRTYKQTEITTL